MDKRQKDMNEKQDKRQKDMNEKQDLILQMLTPKGPMITNDASPFKDSVTVHDVAKAAAAVANGDDNLTTTLGAEYKLKSSGIKKLNTTDKEGNDDKLKRINDDDEY